MLLQLDFSTATPIYQQIRDQIVRGIAEGELAPGSDPDSGIMDALRMRLAELVAGGMSGKEVLALCEHLLDEIAYR